MTRLALLETRSEISETWDIWCPRLL